MTTPSNTYDAVPYAVSAFRQTDPDRLAVIARIFGLNSASPQSCRVLELGCASGGNLLPMAVAYPDSHFVGIDLSQRQIEEGNAVIKQLNLPDVQLHHLSITDVTASLGEFDYILAHGVYSWVPPNVQDKILQICHDNLTPNGVAYVSYNTYPGWHTRAAIREMLCYHTAGASDPIEKIRLAREHLAYLAGFYAASKYPIHAVLAQETAAIQKFNDSYILHEYLEEFNEPVYFHQFVARAAAKKLQFLAEAEISSMLPASFGSDTEQKLRAIAGNPLDLEQHMDFLRTRLFRQTLLCHDHHKLDHTLNPDVLASFHIASPMKPESDNPDLRTDKAEPFVHANRPRLTTRTPLMKAALVILSRRWPMPIPFPDLLAESQKLLDASADKDTRELAEALLNCYTANVVEFSLAPPVFVMHVSEKPATTSYIRFRAAAGDDVANLRLESIALTAPARLVLSHLDGRHDKRALIALVTDLLKKMPPAAESAHSRATRYLDYILPIFAQSALLIK
jgi:methyltransferase-like protein/SAM-dependent methyltransferase